MPILIAHGVRIYPWTTPAESTKMPTITPEGLIPAASLKIAPGGSKEVKTPWLNTHSLQILLLQSLSDEL